jgi:mono/diheme cytochrome c family protein
VDVSVGPDGAIYACDFHNPLIGHYQTSYRDPGRDHGHGRIWRVAAAGRPSVRQPDLASMEPAALLGQLRSPERWTRYQAKQLLFDSPTAVVVQAGDAFLANLRDTDPDAERLRLEIAGVYQFHGTPRKALVQSMLAAEDPRIRAYGTRAAGAWASGVPESASWLAASAVDPNARVRLEALVASMELPLDQAFRRFLDVYGRPRDRFINYALTNAARVLRPYWQPLASSGPEAMPPDVRSLLEGAAGRARAAKHPGQVVYERLCLNCHQPEGKGLANIYPPLAGNPRVGGDPEVLIQMLLHGVKGPMKSNGTVYNNLMPPSGLADAQIADVLSYLRSHFGHESPAVPVALVTRVRKKHADRNAPWETGALNVD